MARVIRTYDLVPCDGHKSFYKKAVVRVYDDGTEVLRSYATDVMSKAPDGTLIRHWPGWSATTGRHIVSFCGIGKKLWDKMDVTDIDYGHSFLKYARGLHD